MNTEDSVDYFALQGRVAELEKQLENSVEVVRCSDCEYRGDEMACPIEGNDLHHISDYDYCSWGERKGGDSE